MKKNFVVDGPDKGAVLHTGSLFSEGKKLESGNAWFDLSYLPIIEVQGEDRLSWLNDISTQELLTLNKEWRSSLILNHQGHIKFQFLISNQGESCFIITELQYKEPLIEFLNKMKFMARVSIIDRSGELGAIWQNISLDFNNYKIEICELEKLEKIHNDLGLDFEVGIWSIEALRIANQIPRIILDGDERAIPNEVKELNRSVHMKKGCYPGQETVAKTFNLGAPPRLLTLLHLDGTEVDLPAVGTAVEFDGIEVGKMGSSARHYLLGNLGLALIKRNFRVKNPNAQLNIAGIAATMEL
jgi:folate-binding protein YgfZ